MSDFKIESFVDGYVIFKIGDPANNLYGSSSISL